MKCSSCDSELRPGATTCDACGAPVQQALEQQAARTASPYDAFSPVETAAESEPAAPTDQAANEEPFAAFQLPPSEPETSYQAPAVNTQTPGAQVYSSPSPVYSTGEKILGMPADQMGNIALGLGGAGCLFSVTGCGALIGILGLIAGFLALKTSGRRNGIIGIILSALGLIIALSLVCGIFFLIFQGGTTYYD